MPGLLAAVDTVYSFILLGHHEAAALLQFMLSWACKRLRLQWLQVVNTDKFEQIHDAIDASGYVYVCPLT